MLLVELASERISFKKCEPIPFFRYLESKETSINSWMRKRPLALLAPAVYTSFERRLEDVRSSRCAKNPVLGRKKGPSV